MTLVIDPDSAVLAADLALELSAAGERFAEAVAELEPLAAELAALEAKHRAARHRAGVMHSHCPPARELAVEVLHGRLQALAPYLPTVTRDAADRAAEQLREACAAHASEPV